MTTAPCQQFEPLLARAADDGLAPAERARLDAHLATCTACGEALEAQRLVRGVLAARTLDQASRDFARRVMAEVERKAAWAERWDFRRWTWRLVPVTAALTIAAYAVSGRASADSTAAAADDGAGASVTVSGALLTDEVGNEDVVSLMLFANADDALADALQEIPR